MLSGPLHTYAGLLNFYLAQPASDVARHANSIVTASENQKNVGGEVDDEVNSAQSVSSRSDPSSVRNTTKIMEPPNPILIRQARAYFVKALAIDEMDVVAAEFVEQVSQDSERIGLIADRPS